MSLANELNAHGHDAHASEGTKGQFDVLRGDELLFSKQREKRFPEPAEILAKL